MNRKNVFSFEMSNLYKVRDRELERVLSEKAPTDPGYKDLYLLVGELRAAFPEKPAPADVESAHLAAILDTALRMSEEPVSGDVAGVDSTQAVRSSRSQAQRRKPVLARLFASRALRATAVAVGVFAIFSGVAVAGALPDPAQSAVSHAAGLVGLSIPDGNSAPNAPQVPSDVTLPDQANVPTTVPVGHTPGTVGVPSHVTLPDQANVPTTVPVGHTPGTVGVPSDVTLPDQANVPTTVPASIPPTPPTTH